MPHLLLVDDDEDILALLTSFFRKHSHIVSTAMNSAEMFAALNKQSIDLDLARTSTRSRVARRQSDRVRNHGL